MMTRVLIWLGILRSPESRAGWDRELVLRGSGGRLWDGQGRGRHR